MACTFCQIIAGKAEATFVHRDEVAAIFLDTRPLIKGHCLLAPVTHIHTVVDLGARDLRPFFLRVRSLAAAIQHAMDAEGSFVAINNIVSQSVPHLHVHVVPRTKGDGLRGFFWPRTKYADRAEMREIANRIDHEFTREMAAAQE